MTQKTIKETLETVIEEIVEKGIFWNEACTQFEKLFIQRALRQARGNLRQAAEIMGVHRNTLSKKIRIHRIDPKDQKKRRGSADS